MLTVSLFATDVLFGVKCIKHFNLTKNGAYKMFSIHFINRSREYTDTRQHKHIETHTIDINDGELNLPDSIDHVVSDFDNSK